MLVSDVFDPALRLRSLDIAAPRARPKGGGRVACGLRPGAGLP